MEHQNEVAIKHTNLLIHDLGRYQTEKVTVGASATYGELKAGTVVGKVNATGVVGIYDPDAEDGRENIYAVLLTEVDATTAAKTAFVALNGEFNQNEITIISGADMATVKDALRNLNIYLVDVKAE